MLQTGISTYRLNSLLPKKRRWASHIHSCNEYGTLYLFGRLYFTCKTVRPMLSGCPVLLSVCNVGVLWPNGWIDQDATWYGDRPWPRQHCDRWRPSSPPLNRKGHSSPHHLSNFTKNVGRNRFAKPNLNRFMIFRFRTIDLLNLKPVWWNHPNRFADGLIWFTTAI